MASSDAEPARDRLTRRIEQACQWLALAGGLILVGIALMSAVSIVGRAVFRTPIQGDYELVQMGCAMFVACCLPMAQIRYSNIIVDFFTVRARPSTRAWLDAFGALVVGVVMALVAWRTGVGLIDMRASGQTSTILGVPTWYTYLGMMPGLVLAAVAGFACAREQALKVMKALQ